MSSACKYVIVIPDGAADEPFEGLGGKTALQAATIPEMDRVASEGIVGRSRNVPDRFLPASDVATLSLFGYDPEQYYTGRAPLEAAAMGIELGPDDWAIRCNLMSILDGRLTDFTAGHITSPEGQGLIESLQADLGRPGIEFHAGVSYRNLMIYRGQGRAASFTGDTVTDPPHDHPDQPAAEHLPRGPGSDLLIDLMSRATPLLADHPVNRARIAAGKRPANAIWLWGQGRAPSVPKFAELHGLKGAIISAVDLVRGVGVLAGWTRLDVPGATGYLDTDYAAKGRAAVKCAPRFRRGLCARRGPRRGQPRGTTRRQGRGDRADRSRDRRTGPRGVEGIRPMADRDHPRSLDAAANPRTRPSPGGLGHGGNRARRLGSNLRRVRGPRSGMPVLRSGLSPHGAVPRSGLGRPDVVGPAAGRHDLERRCIAGFAGRLDRDDTLGDTTGSDTVAVARSEVRRDQCSGFQQDPGRGATGDPGAQARRAGPDRRLRPGQDDRRIDRTGQGDHRDPAGPRDGYAPLDRRAGERRPDGDGHREPGRAGDQFHRGPDRPGHRQLPHQGPDPEHLERADGPGIGRGEDRDRGGLPGGGRALQHHDARPGRFGYHGGRPGRGARRRRLRDLHRC